VLIAATQTIYKSQDVVQVNIPAESGEMGVLANHVPSIEQLKPGLVEVVEEAGGAKQFFRTFSHSIDGATIYLRGYQKELTYLDSLWWIRDRSARLLDEHQRP
jgi:hypothetical protein